MNPVKKALARTQTFVADHKVGIAVVATAAVTAGVMVKIQHSATVQWIDFLESKGIDPTEFFRPEA
jgi:hypothetical protein